VAPPLRKGSALVRQRLTGVAFLLAIGALVLLTVALYQKRFTPVVMVDLKADRIGNQLTPHSDVKVRGLLVGEVRSVSSTGDGATVRLAIARGKAGMVPSDAKALLLPKTLFGEKYVALQVDSGTRARPLRDGDVIPQDRSATSIETERVLDDFQRVLLSLKPAELSYTLNAVAGSLRGRGDEIGANLERTDAYLRQFNPQLPTLRRDMVGLADLADTYDQAAPDFLTVLDNSAFSSRSLVEQRAQLDGFLRATSGFASSADSLLEDNRKRLIDLAIDSTPSLQVYARYSPEYPCLAAALRESEQVVEKTFGGLQPGLHITLEVTRDNGGYKPGQYPKYGDTRGPSCYGLTKKIIPFPDYYNPVDGYEDGKDFDPNTGATKGSTNASPVLFSPRGTSNDTVRLALAPLLGTSPEDVPDVATVMFTALAAGTTIAVT
jgi:phospholipid/cholesterol/gamma-HCH transport system substrate-binding protein